MVLDNRTGSESFSPDGPANIDKINTAAHTVMQKQSPAQRRFANYDLIGTVWMLPGTFSGSAASMIALTMQRWRSIRS